MHMHIWSSNRVMSRTLPRLHIPGFWSLLDGWKSHSHHETRVKLSELKQTWKVPVALTRNTLIYWHYIYIVSFCRTRRKIYQIWILWAIHWFHGRVMWENILHGMSGKKKLRKCRTSERCNLNIFVTLLKWLVGTLLNVWKHTQPFPIASMYGGINLYFS